MDNKRTSVVFMVISALCFSIMQYIIKLTNDIPLFEKVLFRNSVSFIVSLYILIRLNKPILKSRKNLKILLIRSFVGLAGVIAFFYATENLVLTDSTMLNKLSPFFVTIFAAIFLKEKLHKFQIPILIVVFLGCLLIIKPQLDFTIIPALSGTASALFAGTTYTIIRYLKGKEDPNTIVFFFSLISMIGTLPLALLNFIKPNLIELVLLLLIGVFAAGGQIFLTYSYKYGKASEVSIYNYSSVLFSAIIGFVFLNEVPDIYSVFGSVIVISMAILNYILINKNYEQ